MNKKFIEKMGQAMRDHSYNDELWVKLTGGTPASLWKEYLKTIFEAGFELHWCS